MSKKKNVQTTLSEETYQKLIGIAKKNDLTLKQILQNAITQFIDFNSGINPQDPIFNLKPVSYGSKEVSENVDSILYGEKN
jgi:hypothetical protein